MMLEGGLRRPFGPEEAQRAPKRVRSLVGPLPRALPDIRLFLRDQRQTQMNLFDMSAITLDDYPAIWATPVPYKDPDRKGKKAAISGEASGSGSGKRAGYSAGHVQTEELD